MPLTNNEIRVGIVSYLNPEMLKSSSLDVHQDQYDVQRRPYVCLKICGNKSWWAQLTETRDTYSEIFLIKREWRTHVDPQSARDHNWFSINHYVNGFLSACMGDTSIFINASSVDAIIPNTRRLVTEEGIAEIINIFLSCGVTIECPASSFEA